MCHPVALSHWLRPLEKGVLLNQGRLRVELVEGFHMFPHSKRMHSVAARLLGARKFSPKILPWPQINMLRSWRDTHVSDSPTADRTHSPSFGQGGSSSAFEIRKAK